MKQKTGMKVCDRYSHVFYSGNCLTTIFAYTEPTYYNCGECGWNNDMYVEYTTDSIIMWGNRNTRGTRIPRELYKKHNEIARNILENFKLDYTSEDAFEKSLNKRVEMLEKNALALIHEMIEREEK